MSRTQVRSGKTALTGYEKNNLQASCLLSKRAVKQFLKHKYLQAEPRSLSCELRLCFQRAFTLPAAQQQQLEQTLQFLPVRINSKTGFKTETVRALHQLFGSVKATRKPD